MVELLALWRHKRLNSRKTERAGFEPAMEFNPHTRLAGECLQPLGHLSWNRDASLEPGDHAARPRTISGCRGRVAERLNAAVLKTVRRANPVSGVRIPPLPSPIWKPADLQVFLLLKAHADGLVRRPWTAYKDGCEIA